MLTGGAGQTSATEATYTSPYYFPKGVPRGRPPQPSPLPHPGVEDRNGGRRVM